MKLHLGCGNRRLHGFINIDIIKFEAVDIVQDIKNLSNFKSESIDLIYSSHVLEHFFLYEVNSVLQEWRRVLKINGTLRLAVPSFEKLIVVYNKYKDLNLLFGCLYGKGVREGACETPHKTVYDFKFLKNILKKNRFRNVCRWDWRKVFVGENKDFDDYSKAYIPHMDFENGIHVSLNVECIK